MQICEPPHAPFIRKSALFHVSPQPFLVELACDKTGSRTLDGLWAGAPPRRRTTLAAHLSRHADRLRGDRFGRFVWSNLGLDYFLSHRDDWTRVEADAAKKKRLFADLIGRTGERSVTSNDVPTKRVELPYTT